jgi:hypothetical protein
MVSKFLSKFSSSAKTVQVKVAIEYVQPHWVVLIQNPGHKSWIALRDPSKLVRVPNHFNDVVKQFPAVQTFSSYTAASEWVHEHLGHAQIVQRNHSEVAKFLHMATSPIGTHVE